ncbi:MAG TPA: CPBP family intramembrane metalloprotease [Phycisphaerae bacterium]|nr:CPBP family intramembrane metalloprotease [Phycisphaerales bacterium]HRX83931.1 CPBP family intramembrane metalloprotease [Phycisphaerae bacterium]
MATSRTRKPQAVELEAPSRWPTLSQPLETLVFLLPFILLYQLGCMLLHTAPGQVAQERIVAFHLLQVFFELFGTTGVWMPGLAVVVILLCTQVASRRPWRVRKRTVGFMYAEAGLLAVPLIALNHVLRIAPLHTGAGGDVATEAILGIGAGVYEELVFRLVLISALVMLASDFLNMPAKATTVVAVIISALAFAAHHHPPLGSEPFEATAFTFRACAGLYLGALFVYRGYGPAAGTHAAYNLLIVLLG